MKKAILLLCIAAGLVSCAKEAPVPEKVCTGIPMTFDVTVLETKTAKTGWVDGDKIYVFFNGLESKYLILERSGDSWTNTSGGETLLDTDFSGLETKTLTAVHFPAPMDVDYADSKFSFTSDGKPVYNYYLCESGAEYTVDGSTVLATLSLGKPANMVQIHVAGIQESVADYTFGCSKIKPMACTSVGIDGAITESVLQAGARLSGLADADGGVFAGQLTNPGSSTDYVFTMASDDNIYTLTRNSETLRAGKMYNFPALSETGGYNWTVTAASDLYVDLGIVAGGKTIYWAKRNLNASSETDRGGFYAWGEIQTKKYYYYNWSDYYWGTDKTKLKRYNSSDRIFTLLPEDDAAYAALGGKFRMPKDSEVNALLATKSNTTDYTWTWCDGSTVQYNGSTAKGWMVVKNSSSATLFLPSGGLRNDNSYVNIYKGHYWTSSLRGTGSAEQLANVFFWENGGDPKLTNFYRTYGMNIRPVSE